MSTSIRPEVSEKNHYWIERHRYYELKHFCLQYPLWKQSYNALDSTCTPSYYDVIFTRNHPHGDPVTKCAEARQFYADRMEMIERVAKETSEELGSYLLKAITEGISYDHLNTQIGVPCCKDVYYDLYRRFFWLLSKERQ